MTEIYDTTASTTNSLLIVKCKQDGNIEWSKNFNSNSFLKYLTALFLCIVLYSCHNQKIDAAYVKSKIWSYDGGFKIGKGDFVIFDEQEKLFELKGDTIYYDKNPRAIITNIDTSVFSMNIRSVDGKETGIYRNIEESLR